MATLEQLSAALVKADAAGNAADAKALADAIRQMQTQPQTRGTVPEEQRGLYGTIRPYVAPALEAGGAIAGGALGAVAGTFGAGPVGTAAGGVAGAGLGYGIGKEAMQLADVYLGGKAPRVGAAQVVEPVQNILEGATMEVGGQLAGRALGAGVQAVGGYVNKLKDLKSTAILDAIENKGRDIVNALRGEGAVLTPGSAPTTGEIAATAGSAKFSAFQEGLKKQASTEYADMAAQTGQARIEQTSRVVDRFKNVVSRIKDKIDRGLTDVSPRETGEALLAAAKAEQQTVKKGLIEPAYTRAFKKAGDAKIDAGGVVSTAENILERKLTDFAPETAPNTVRKLLALKPPAAETAPVLLDAAGKPIKQIAPPRPEATLQQLDDIRKAINADIAAAKTSAMPSSDMTLRNLYKLHDAIDEAVAGSKTLPPAAKEAYGEALGLYRDIYAPRFKTGVNAQLFKQTSLNEPKIEPDKVIKTFFKPQGEREATQFVDMFGKNADAMRVARSGIEDLYRQKVVDATTGMVNPAKHAQFMKEYGRPLGILDDAGMNVTTRLDVAGKDAQRLARVEQMAKESGNKLAPPLPAGANAMAVEKRIGDLTKNLTPQQLSAVDAVRKDLLREAEYERLVKAGGGTIGAGNIATEAGKKIGMPFPSLLSTPITLFNSVAKKLMLKMDDKLAMELARELTNPALAAQTIEKAMAMEAARKGAAQGSVLPLLGRAATTGGFIQSQQP
ncbi:hypothetical protein UFOVP161_52 [uncultured Caudovirales phage]|uniref:Uncharacterized protein n=1 Tax=uncultured Caudovirales phage TaxID=2100421 RepID=A0A6J7WDN0_9CAUD|nr:hypothetical protein UFOVP161_52 [uncultured Caudovirales phage]